MDDGEMMLAMAATSECSSGCQSGWTTYLDDRSSSRSCGTTRSKARRPYHAGCEEEEDDLSMISDASSGPRQQCSAGDDAGQGGGGGAAASAAVRRGRRVDAASARRHSKKSAAASLLEDTASSPAFFGYTKATMSSGEGYDADETMMEIGNAAVDFSCAFSATTAGFKSPLNGASLHGYLNQMPHYSPEPMMPTRQVSTHFRGRDGEAVVSGALAVARGLN